MAEEKKILFLIGMIAISAMFLPGISGSTLLLIFGAYIPALFFFGMGILAGAATVVKGIKICLERFRPQAVYAILGMMVGSFYAILQGPTTLDVPKPAMTPETFNIIACVIGLILVLGLQKLKELQEK